MRKSHRMKKVPAYWKRVVFAEIVQLAMKEMQQ